MDGKIDPLWDVHELSGGRRGGGGFGDVGGGGGGVGERGED